MSTNGAPESKTEFIDGRPITLKDLLDRHLLRAGEQIRLDVPDMARPYRASLTSNGRIQLENGKGLANPGKAAQEVLGDEKVDGWSSWTREEDGRSLDEMRQVLLEQEVRQEAAKESTSGDRHLSLALRRHERLTRARKRANEHAPERVVVGELIGLWGGERRSPELMRLVEVDLANHGLTTRPSIRDTSMNGQVKLVRTTEGHDRLSPTVGALPSARGDNIKAIRDNAPVYEAVTIMLLKDYSQLPVFDKRGNLKGAVTWKSIARAKNLDPGCGLDAAIEPCDPVESHRELLDVLPEIQEKGFVFVNSERSGLSGIVTTSDVVQRYSEAATPFLLVGVIDTLLRRVIAEAIPMDNIKKLCEIGDKELGSVNELTMGDYKRILEYPDNWGLLGWPLDRAFFVDQLNEIVSMRNAVMHFNPDPLPADCVGQLKSMISVLREYGDL